MIKIDTNEVSLKGKVASDIVFSHEVKGERFFEFFLEVERLSEYTDKILIIASESRMDKVRKEELLEVKGEYRSFNKPTEEGRKLVLFVFAYEINVYNCYFCINNNKIKLEGTICMPIYSHETSKGIIVSETMIAVNRSANRSAYIPIVTWNLGAKKLKKYNIGETVKIWGRIQSREYPKRLQDEKIEMRTAYEISVSSFY